MKPSWTSDDGRCGERVATILPSELHTAIAESALDGLRRGLPLELLDGMEAYRVLDLRGLARDTVAQRRTFLEGEIRAVQTRQRNARRNANEIGDPELRQEFLADMRQAKTELTELESQLQDLDRSGKGDDTVGTFTSECDYIAHALAGVATVTYAADHALADALSRVLEIVAMDPYTDAGKVAISFNLLVPADGRVARLGPIRCTVPNHAYPATLPRDMQQGARSRLAERARMAFGRKHASAAGPTLLAAVSEALTSKGYGQAAARLMTRPASEAIRVFVAHELWDDPLPREWDPDFVTWLRGVYKSPEFGWNPRYSLVDTALRQAAVDAAVELGGRPTYTELLDATRGTLNDLQLNAISRDQKLGRARVWNASLRRWGTWTKASRRSLRGFLVAPCPHCSGLASRVVRVPEVTADLLCPDCRRMPLAGSPQFPDDYLGRMGPE